ncbi:hypothetical protein D3C86_1405900 [compost metagenome]
MYALTVFASGKVDVFSETICPARGWEKTDDFHKLTQLFLLEVPKWPDRTHDRLNEQRSQYFSGRRLQKPGFEGLVDVFLGHVPVLQLHYDLRPAFFQGSLIVYRAFFPAIRDVVSPQD